DGSNGIGEREGNLIFVVFSSCFFLACIFPYGIDLNYLSSETSENINRNELKIRNSGIHLEEKGEGKSFDVAIKIKAIKLAFNRPIAEFRFGEKDIGECIANAVPR